MSDTIRNQLGAYEGQKGIKRVYKGMAKVADGQELTNGVCDKIKAEDEQFKFDSMNKESSANYIPSAKRKMKRIASKTRRRSLKRFDDQNTDENKTEEQFDIEQEEDEEI